MSADKDKRTDYERLTPTKKTLGAESHADTSLKAPRNSQNQAHKRGENPPSLTPIVRNQDKPHAQELTNLSSHKQKEFPSESLPETLETKAATQTEVFVSEPPRQSIPIPVDIPYSEQNKDRKQKKRADQDEKLLANETWLKRNGHTLSYVGLYLFTILVLFRPYELISGLSFLSATAFYFALATLLVYAPTQLSTEGNLTAMSTEVKAILALTFISLLTMPISKDPALAWQSFNDTYIKAVVMFIVMVNVLRTRRRLMGMLWLSMGTAVILSYQALDMFMKGDLRAEGYRVEVEIGGLFGNPNDLALHLVTMVPISLCLAFASKSTIMRIVFFMMTALFIGANFVTYSRGGFLGLVAASAVMVWKLGRKSRLKVSFFSIIVGLIVTLLAPGNYGVRILSIFGLAPDEVGSRDQRRELLERSIVVSLRNPWGIGIGNFPIVGVRNLQTHNAFTQVSSELGLLGLAAYLIFILSPLRKLGAIERTLFAKDERNWFYFMSVGLYASIVAYLVSSFFVAVAYNWFIYYLIAYAVAFRRIYQIEQGLKDEVQPAPLTEVFGLSRTTANV